MISLVFYRTFNMPWRYWPTKSPVKIGLVQSFSIFSMKRFSIRSSSGHWVVLNMPPNWNIINYDASNFFSVALNTNFSFTNKLYVECKGEDGKRDRLTPFLVQTVAQSSSLMWIFISIGFDWETYDRCLESSESWPVSKHFVFFSDVKHAIDWLWSFVSHKLSAPTDRKMINVSSQVIDYLKERLAVVLGLRQYYQDSGTVGILLRYQCWTWTIEIYYLFSVDPIRSSRWFGR